MSLVADLKKENKQLKKALMFKESKEKEYESIIKTLKEKEKTVKVTYVENNNGKEEKGISNIAETTTPKIVDKDKFIMCTLSQNNNITEGRNYFLLDKYVRKGNIYIEIIDNNNIIRTYNKEKFFA